MQRSCTCRVLGGILLCVPLLEGCFEPVPSVTGGGTSSSGTSSTSASTSDGTQGSASFGSTSTSGGGMPTPPVQCGLNQVCDTSDAPVCCYEFDPANPQAPGPLSCVPDLDDCPGSAFACDDDGDCPRGQVCCARFEAGMTRATCLDPAVCSNSSTYDEDAVEMCTGGTMCADGYLCLPRPEEFDDIPAFYETCQPVPYGPCVPPSGQNPASCVRIEDMCEQFDGMGTTHHVCALDDCDPNQPNPCPDAPLADGAQPACVQTGNASKCFLDCTGQGDTACPPGMVCLGTIFMDPIDICVWPLNPDGMGP